VSPACLAGRALNGPGRAARLAIYTPNTTQQLLAKFVVEALGLIHVAKNKQIDKASRWLNSKASMWLNSQNDMHIIPNKDHK
jgi:hypothetical protein